MKIQDSVQLVESDSYIYQLLQKQIVIEGVLSKTHVNISWITLATSHYMHLSNRI